MSGSKLARVVSFCAKINNLAPTFWLGFIFSLIIQDLSNKRMWTGTHSAKYSEAPIKLKSTLSLNIRSLYFEFVQIDGALLYFAVLLSPGDDLKKNI